MDLYLHMKKKDQPLVKILNIYYFGTLSTCLDMPTQNVTIPLQLSWIFTYIHEIKTIAQSIIEILKLSGTENAQACLTTPTQKMTKK